MTSFSKRLSLSGNRSPSVAPRILSRGGNMALDLTADTSTAARDLVAIAGSSGGLDALRAICSALPADFPGAIAVVQHRMAVHGSLLCELLGSWTSLDVRDAREGDRLAPGLILIAPADRHMTITADRTVALVGGGAIHHVLSSADPLFASAALAYRDRLTAIVLTGGDGDGSAGVRSVKHEGGTVWVQDPAAAVNGEMPRSSLLTGMVDRVLPLGEIAEAMVVRVGGSRASGRKRAVGAT